jgi:chromosome segregation ATPase
MKNVNDLALMLSESLDNMNQQMSGAACSKPKKSGKGDGQKPMDKITEGQKNMKESLEQMKKSMEQGKAAESKEFAKAAARQAALREALRELQKDRQQHGEKTDDLQKLIEGMDKMETELVNKQLTNEMMQRQNEILTRLLEAENAERERKQDEKRKSTTAQELERKLPPSLQEYLKKREAEIDLYKTVSPDVKPYYRSLVEEYMKSLRTEHGNTNNK